VQQGLLEGSFSALEEERMPKCDGCGNDYDKAFQVVVSNKTYTFDSFECAINQLAPTCTHCGVRIIGHGLEKSGAMFCCNHCAEKEGVTELRDRS
jgi:hypothetical protein